MRHSGHGYEITIEIRFANMTQFRPLDWVQHLGFVLVPLLAVVAHKGLVVILVCLGAVALLSAIKHDQLRAVFTRRTILVCGVGFTWLVLASLLSPDPKAGVLKSIQIAGLGVLYFLLTWHLRTLSKEKKSVIIAALACSTLAAFMLLVFGYFAIGVVGQDLIEIRRANEITVLYPGFVTAAILLPSVYGYLQQKKWAGGVWGVAAAALVLSFAINSITATVLVTLTIVFYALFRNDPWQLPRILALLLVVVTITLPISMPLVLDRVAVVFVEDDSATDDVTPVVGSVAHHYHIWRFAADRAAERPFLGWGFNSSRTLPGGHRLMAENAELLPLHPHNAVLQVWLELGVPGLVLLCFVLWRAYMPTGWQDFSRRELLIRTSTVSAVFFAASTTFGIWQSWWLSAIALALASTSLWHEGEA